MCFLEVRFDNCSPAKKWHMGLEGTLWEGWWVFLGMGWGGGYRCLGSN